MGMFPDSKLKATRMDVKFDKLQIDVGMGPWISFMATSKYANEAKSPRDVGKLPVIELLAILNSIKLDNNTIVVGNDLVR